MVAIVIDGFTPDDKVPQFAGALTFGGGKQSIGAIALKCTCFGNKTSAGTAPLNSMLPATTPEEAAALWGARSELARMAYAAFESGGSDVTFWGVVVDEAAGAAATATVTFAGSFGSAGSAVFQADEEVFTVNFAASDNTATLAAVAFVNKFNSLQNGRMFGTAANSAGVVTITTANLGLRGNFHTFFVVNKLPVPTGMTIAIAGGTALANGGVPFTGGSGTDDVTTALTGLDAVQLDYVGSAQNDATNVGLYETHANAKASFDVQLFDLYHVSGNGTQGAAIAIGQTQMNDVMGQFVWIPLGVEHPSRVAARMAALRSVTEGAQPNFNYDEIVLKGAPPHFRTQDSPSHAVQKAALNAGLTICQTVDGKMQIVRAIGSRSLNGSTPDYRTLDVADTAVPIRVVKELRVEYQALKASNRHAGPDLDPDALPPGGTFSPNLWKHAVTALMQSWASSEFNWVTAVDENPTVAQWDSVGERVMSATPVIVKSQNHSVGAKVNQTAA